MPWRLKRTGFHEALCRLPPAFANSRCSTPARSIAEVGTELVAMSEAIEELEAEETGAGA